MKLNNLGLFKIVFIFVFLLSKANAFEVQVAEAPDNDLGLTTAALKSAKQTLLLNIYELTSQEIVDVLLDRIRAGVHVEILEEGQPVGGLSAPGKKAQQQLVQAMTKAGGSNHLFEMTSKAGGKRRFHFDHGKYALIDGKSILIGSENYSPTGNPQPGKIGNRGWEVFIHETGIVNIYNSVFKSDTKVSYGDVRDLAAEHEAMVSLLNPGFPTALFTPETDATPGEPMAARPINKAAPILNASEAKKISSPDSSLPGLLEMLKSATSKIDIELMSLNPSWGTTGKNSPLYDAILAAARRGVSVRVLLNDETVFGTKPAKSKNLQAVNAFNKIGKSEKLSLEAKTADVKAMGVDYIHNKGVLVDDDKTLISSINWNENSVEKNREAAVLLVSAEIHDHYEVLFEEDWGNSVLASAY